MRIQRELDVASADDSQRADHFGGNTAEHLILPVGERLGRRDDDAVTRMDAHRIEIFHVADDDAGIIGITHYFVFDFFPPFDAALDEHLVDRAGGDSVCRYFPETRFAVGDSSASAAERVRGTDDDRIADGGCELDGLLHGFNSRAFRHGLPDSLHQLLEQLAVFSVLNRSQGCTQQLHSVLFQYACFRK